MRQVRSALETKVFNCFNEYLGKSKYTSYKVDPGQIDKPDMGVEIEGVKIGIEFVIFEAEKFIKWDKTLPKPGPTVAKHKARIYMEGGKAIKRILELKSPKFHSYVNVCDYKKIWLVIHSDYISLQEIKDDLDFFIEQSSEMAKKMKCPFEKILYLHIPTNEFHNLFEKGKSVPKTGLVQKTPSFITRWVFQGPEGMTLEEKISLTSDLPLGRKIDEIKGHPESTLDLRKGKRF